MKILFWLLPILILSGKVLHAQNINIDSLQRDVDRYTKEDTVRVNKLLELGKAIPGNQKEKAEAIFLQAEKLAVKIGWKKGEAYALFEISKFYGDHKQFDKGISAGLRVIDLAIVLKDSSLLAFVYTDLGDTYRYMGDKQQGITLANKGLSVARRIKNQKMKLYAYSLLARSYSEMKQWEQSRFYVDSAIKTASAINDHRSRARMISLLGHEQAELKNFDKAKDYYLLYLQTEIEAKNQVGISWGSCLLSRNYASMKQIDSAMFFANQAAEICLQNKMDPDEAYFSFYKAYEAASNYKQALKYRMLYDSCFLKSYNVNAGQNVAEVQGKSEQDKKDLITKLEQDKIQSEARRSRDIQYVIIGVVVLIAMFFYWFSQQKQKAKLKIEQAYTELKSTQSQLIQSEKMASLGELTAGIAHEIQNPLNFVNNFSELNSELIVELKDELTKGNLEEAKAIAGDIDENEQKILHHGKRADAIVKGMLQHSRSSSGKKEPTDINALADEYLRLAYHGLRAKDKSFNAKMETDFDASIGMINIIPQDIGRVILNLITNAFYAVNEMQKFCQAEPVEANRKYEPMVAVSTKKIGDRIEIMVKDNGNGIPERVLDKIFQPFFTTKPTGQGTGLGLSLSYDIVKAHGGELKVETKEGVGTIFTAQLPMISIIP